MKYVNKAAKRCIDAIKINIEHRLKHVYEIQSEYLSGRYNQPEVYAEKTKYELTCITESMLWIRRYIPEFDNYTSKDGRCTVKLVFDDTHHSLITDIKDWPYFRKPIPPLTRSNPGVSVKVVMSGFPGDVTRSFEYTVKRKTADDIIREEIENYRKYGCREKVTVSFSNKR